MALYPKNKSRFYISDTSADAVYDKTTNERIFRGGGTDYSDRDMVLYVASVPLGRVVTIKAFIESLKLSLQKEIEKKDLKNSALIYDREYSTEMSYDVTLNMPAHSTNEAANNLAKIEELQRLIMPVTVTRDSSNKIEFGAIAKYGVDVPLFVVWFRNIINSGHKKIKKKKTTNSFSDIIDAGFPCYIEEIDYQPDMDAGFFENDSQLFPRNIKLNLKLNFDSHTIGENVTNNLVISPFVSNGSYGQKDTSLFPFGVVVRGETGFAERPNEISKKTVEMTQKQMNDISMHRNTSHVFISLPIPQNKNPQPSQEDRNNELLSFDDWCKEEDNLRVRYVLFPAFLESFSRRIKTSTTTNTEKGAPIYRKIGVVKAGSLDYNFKINIPSYNLNEAKKNCAKIQYLLRMFIKKEDATAAVPAANSGDVARTAEEMMNSDLESSEKKDRIRVYIPKKLERPGSSGAPTDFATMYANSLSFLFESIDFEIDFDSGFFEEGSQLFPKNMSITIGISDTTQQYNSTIQLSGSSLGNSYSLLSNGQNDFTESERQLFPFNRRTSNFKIIGE